MRQKSLSKTLNALVTRLVARFDPDEIIPFGSHARGTAQSDSDIDLLVVSPIQGSHRTKQVEMRVALHDLHVPTDIIVATPKQVAQQQNVPSTLIRSVLAEGKLLYARKQKTRRVLNDVAYRVARRA